MLRRRCQLSRSQRLGRLSWALWELTEEWTARGEVINHLTSANANQICIQEVISALHVMESTSISAKRMNVYALIYTRTMLVACRSQAPELHRGVCGELH